MSDSGQTKKRHPTGILPRKRQGGQPGNRNAARPVLALSTLCRRIRALKRRAKLLLALVPGGMPVRQSRVIRMGNRLD